METTVSPPTVLGTAKKAVAKKFANFLPASRKDSFCSRSSNSSNVSPADGSLGHIGTFQTSCLAFTSSESSDGKAHPAKGITLQSGAKPRIEKTLSLQERSSRESFLKSKGHASSVDSPTWNENEGPKSLSFWKVPIFEPFVSAESVDF